MALDEGKRTQPIEKAGAKPRQRTMLGRFAAVTPPAVTLLLSVVSKPAAAVTSGGASSRQLKEPVAIPQLRKSV